MAYVSQEQKAKLAPAIKAVLKKYNVKGSIAVRHHSTLVVNIKSGEIDFIGNYNAVSQNRAYYGDRPHQAEGSIDVNVYHIDSQYTGTARECLLELLAAMKGPDFFDKSDIQSDYFHVSHYLDINVGQWDKPYQLAA